MFPDEVKDLFKIHVQTSKSGNANGKITNDSNLTNYGLVKLITLINDTWDQPEVPPEERLKIIESLVFVNLTFMKPKARPERWDLGGGLFKILLC